MLNFKQVRAMYSNELLTESPGYTDFDGISETVKQCPPRAADCQKVLTMIKKAGTANIIDLRAQSGYGSSKLGKCLSVLRTDGRVAPRKIKGKGNHVVYDFIR